MIPLGLRKSKHAAVPWHNSGLKQSSPHYYVVYRLSLTAARLATSLKACRSVIASCAGSDKGSLAVSAWKQGVGNGMRP